MPAVRQKYEDMKIRKHLDTWEGHETIWGFLDQMHLIKKTLEVMELKGGASLMQKFNRKCLLSFVVFVSAEENLST